jgi:uncharacterized protein YfbU (UPF0304 family)
VIDILAMYDHLIMSFQRLADKQGLKELDITFRGFDAAVDSESKQWVYAHHLLEDQKRFKTKAQDLKGCSPMLPQYRQALRLWEQAKPRHTGPEPWLSAEEIKEIIAPLSQRSNA